MSVSNLPTFLLKHLDVIAKSEGVTEYTVQHEAGSKHGDGFMSEMTAITLIGKPDGAKHRLDLICKRLPAGATCQKEFKAHLVCERETFMYTDVLPLFGKLQLDNGIIEKDGFYAYPKCYVAEYKSSNVDEAVIIMQDLRAADYRLWPKGRITTVSNIRLLLQQMGRLHGLSFVLRDQQPEVFAKLEAIPDCVMPVFDNFAKMFTSSFERAISVLESEVDRNVMRHMRDNCMKLIKNSLDIQMVGNSAVLVHGDTWNNNMMFKFDMEEQAEKICLIDWQISRMSSPVVDLSNYLLSSTDKEMRDKHILEFLSLYHTSVTEQIRKFGSDPDKLFSYADYENQLRKFGYYGLLFAPMALPILVSDTENIVKTDDMIKNMMAEDTKDAHLATLTNQTEVQFRQRLSDSIQDARTYGWLDAVE